MKVIDSPSPNKSKGHRVSRCSTCLPAREKAVGSRSTPFRTTRDERACLPLCTYSFHGCGWLAMTGLSMYGDPLVACELYLYIHLVHISSSIGEVS